MTRIAVIADDLTGALDTVPPFVCHGLRAKVLLDGNSFDESIDGTTDVIGITTNSRHLPPDGAGQAARAAAEALRDWEPDLVLKKIDSRLKGNMSVETSAVAKVFGALEIIVAPAVPDQGRFVENGKVIGAGVDAALDVAGRFASVTVPLSIRNTLSDTDLDRIALEWRPERSRLYVGARGLAAALARRFTRSGPRQIFSVQSPVIVAVGSRDPVTVSQVDALCASGGYDCIAAPSGRLAALRASHRAVVLQCTGNELQTPEVAQTFAVGIAAAISRLRPLTLLLSGGDTALAVIRALGVAAIEICGEAAPGLPWFMIPVEGGTTISTISKSGGFGDRGTLSRLLCLEGKSYGTR